MSTPTLYAIIDPSYVANHRQAAGVTRDVVRGGATVVQLRDKTSSTRKLLALARDVREICTANGATFIVNDRLDVALACGADGVHLGPDDLPVEEARKIAAGEFIIGASAGTPKRALELAAQGADYLGVGAIFDARESKPDASEARGPEAIKAVVNAVDIPVVAIGGITPSNALDVIAQGASGVAVIRALMRAEDAASAARRFMARLKDSAPIR